MLDFNQAIQSLKVTNDILILPSSPADGDSIGSALAMFHALKSQGKNATVVLMSDLPEIYKFLPGSTEILKDADINPDFVITIDLRDTKLKDVSHEIQDNKVNIILTPENGSIKQDQVVFPEPAKKYDLLITVDCAELSQLGDFYKNYGRIFGEVPSINIDHHESNANYASINLVDPSASSTTQILVQMFNAMGIQMTPDLATLLLAGIITDTSSFQNQNTTPECFDIAANLIEQGARQQEIIKNVYKTKQLEALKLWGRILSNIKVDEANRIVWTTVPRSLFEETATSYQDIGDIIDELLANAEEADTVLMLVEKADGTLHGSIRTTEAKDAVQLAAQFGGGGHARAAGFNIPNATIAQKEEEILNAFRGGNAPQPESTPEPTPEPELTVPEPTPPEPSEAPTPAVEELPQPEPIEADPVEKLARDFVSKPAESETIEPEASQEEPTPLSTDDDAIPDFLKPLPEQPKTDEQEPPTQPLI